MIYPAAGTSASGVPMTFAQLLAVTSGQVGDFTVAEADETHKKAAAEER